MGVTHLGGGGGGHSAWGGGVPSEDNRMSTHYTAGGMPLAFTQEDFLVLRFFHANCYLVYVHVCVWYVCVWCVCVWYVYVCVCV